MNHAVPSKLANESSESDAALDLLLDQQLNAPEEQLAASSGFALSVMEAIQVQAAEPPPIAFPWRRVVPGSIAILCALAGFVVYFAVWGGPAAGRGVRMGPILPATFSLGQMALCGIVLAILISVAALAASFRLAGRSR